MDKEELNDIKIHDELFIFWLAMKNEKDSDKRDAIIAKTAGNIEKALTNQAKEPKYKIGDTVVLTRRWLLWFKEPVLCEVVGGYFEEEEDMWRYILKIGNQLRRFYLWENQLK